MFTHGPDTRIENSVFVDNNVAITPSNRTYLLRPADRVKRWEDNILKRAKHRQPPWSRSYPQVVSIPEDKPIGAPRRIVIKRNIATGGPFLRVSGDFNYDANTIENNWEEGRSDPVILVRERNKRQSYPQVFERRPGELWATTWQGGAFFKMWEKEFVGGR